VSGFIDNRLIPSWFGSTTVSPVHWKLVTVTSRPHNGLSSRLALPAAALTALAQSK
jgi:hypothetical protein